MPARVLFYLLMQLNLKNPIVFFDLETTGISIATDRIVEISILKINVDGSREERNHRVNPQMPIPAQSSAIHGITDKDVKDCPPFKEIARSIAAFIDKCDIGGFNSNKFDIPLLAEEFIRAGIDFDIKKRKFVDVQTIFHKMESLENAHSAQADTLATYEVLLAQLDRYPELQNDIDFLADFSSHNKSADLAARIVFNEKNEEVFNFGKYKGRKVAEVFDTDQGYYGWMMNGDFSQDTKKVITAIKLRKLTGK